MNTPEDFGSLALPLPPAEVDWLRRAIELAERGLGRAEPNPLVGAMVVRDGRVVGEGWHQAFGAAHAEVNSLDAAGPLASGATLYVSLEPCCHHGKTPPCTQRIIAAGIARVVAAMSDPFPEVAGEGFAALQRAGVQVAHAEAASSVAREARRLNAPYLKLLAQGVPYVHAKWAMTLDGKIATAGGRSRWISGEAARARVHELRGRVDAILVGAGTVRADDPLLTARPPGPRTATRIVLDTTARLASQSQLARTAREVPVIVATTSAADSSDLKRLEAAGCECLAIPDPHESHTGDAAGRGVPILPLLEELGRRRITHLLVEGGASVFGSFLDAGQIDAVHLFLAPKLLGGAEAKSAVAGHGRDSLDLAVGFDVRELSQLGDDVYLRAERPMA